MKVPGWLAVGACSHPGRVRQHNEDDYLLGSLAAAGVTGAAGAGGGSDGALLAAIADGMGGMAGGAEASRLALRALGAVVLDGGSRTALPERLRTGFDTASARVLEAAEAVPALREMGTTMSALCLTRTAALTAHIGDTRIYRLRGGGCEPLTVDHAVRQPDNLLTRCIGAGQVGGPPDQSRFELQPGDRFVLVSDGVWSVLAAATFARLAGAGTPAVAAEALVAAALAGGGPDNATAVVVEVLRTPRTTALDVELPRHERPDERQAWPVLRSLRPPRWPWLLLAVAAVVIGDVAWRTAGGPGLLGWLSALLRGSGS